MSLLWTSDALVAATDGRPVGTMPDGVTGISIDSRTLKPGEAFFAIKGDAMDGHDFATAAMAAGAGLLVVAEEKLAGLGRLSVPKVVVPDVLVALEKLGRAARARARATIVAITGSAGKTSTKEALRLGLSAVGTVHASDKSFNNHWGVPLTLARMPEDCDYAIFEIGMNHAGEIRPLVGMVRPHIAIVTLIAAAHLGHFRDLDEIAAAKAEIFEGVESGGAALINRDDERWKLLEKLARSAGIDKVLGFGEHSKSIYWLRKVSLEAEGSTVTVDVAGKEYALRIGAAGRHIVQNVLAVLGAAHLAGADVAMVAKALAGLEAEEGRGRRHLLGTAGGRIVLIDESYNANPASMQAALALLRDAPVAAGGRRVAVLGDMLELGEHASELHAGLAPLVTGSGCDLVLLAGPHMARLAEALAGGPEVVYRPTADELKLVLLDSLRSGDTVMVKSSKGVGFSKLVAALLKQYPAQADDRKRA